MGGAWHGAGRELFLGLGPNNRNNGNNGVWLAVVVLVVSNRLLFKLGSQYKTVLGGAARLDFPGFDLLRVLYVPFV